MVDYTPLITDYKKELFVKRNQMIHALMNQQMQNNNPNKTPGNPQINFRNMTFVSRPTENP
jgi:hypothetical protein